MISNFRGIEGDDISFHLDRLGYDINYISNRVWFYPLNDHYNTHNKGWAEQATQQAKEHEVIIFYDLVNTGDIEHTQFCEFVKNFNHPYKCYLTVNQNTELKIEGVRILPWDFMWNRTRAYYTEELPPELNLHHCARGQYTLPALDFTTPRNKKFLSLTGRDYGYRTNLYEFINKYDGYISNRARGQYLEDNPVIGAYNPIPNKYYMDSYISIYVESNCLATDLIHITEKSFEPLIKGHIILPFSNPGTIERLKGIDFKFPDFVDYSFDSIKDPAKRFAALTTEFKRLLTLDLLTLYAENKDIFIHNQGCVETIKYDHRVLRVFDV